MDRQYAYYEVLFDSVSGLSEAAGVSYNGLPVGQVVSLEIDSEDTTKIRVRLQADPARAIHGRWALDVGGPAAAGLG